MDSVKSSFKGYGKVDELEQQAFRRKTRRRLILLGLSSLTLFLIIAGAVAGTLIYRSNYKGHGPAASDPPPELTPSTSLRTVCSVTEYPDSCFSSISTYDTSNTTDPKQLFKLSLQAAASEVARFGRYVNLTAEKGSSDAQLAAVMEVCSVVVDDAESRFNDSVSVIEGKKLLSESTIDDVRTWLSTAVTDLDTCLDSLREMNSSEINRFTTEMENSTELASNSLAIVTKILALISIPNVPIIHRKLLDRSESDFPHWVGPAERRILAAEGLKPNMTVAADGTGDCLTIGEAVEKVPEKSEARFVVYVKEGTYNETVVVEKSKWNVMMYGDGKEKTIVTGKLNFIDGTPTFKTATFVVVGKGFIARDIGFKNTAGPEKHQAVAFRSGSDMSVFYRCSFDAYQDTLYAHSNRQFYRECDITGTVDFIFGNSAVVFQNCDIIPRQPLENQFNTITAQGKKDPNQNTGISIHKCTISASDGLTAQTYLGRPWKNYSTTVIMQSSIGSFLDPQGWIEWVSGVDPPSTLFYGEYQNNGGGSSTSERVAWSGYKSALSSTEAEKFTVGSFLQGTQWLQQTSVTFDPSL